MLKIGFIGAGTVGSALALQLANKGYHVAAVSSRNRVSAEKLAKAVPGCKANYDNQAVADCSDLVFITTPDDVIAKIAGEVKWRPGQSVVHCSGADSTAILEPARRSGAAVGCFHPLQTFAGVQRAMENIPGSTFAIEAEEPLMTVLKEMSSALDSHSIELKAEDKAVYHASAVMVSNYLVTLVKMAIDLWETMGIPKEEATRALLPLLKGTINNIETIGLPGCLTGPIARGDVGTIKKHLESLEKAAPELLPAYRELARQTIPVALAKGKINERQAEALKSILENEPV
ncbi:MAG: DUF2520 domain-containing protein, partial [Dehalococcoidales bacterium]|nr:DUF2520 domain-containing protein [Dehalococcoidales bacterium]